MTRILIYALLFLIAVQPYAFTAASYDEPEQDGYITIFDEKGRSIMQTGLNIQPGDEFIDEDDSVYEVIAVENNIAKARYIRNDLSISTEPESIPVQTSSQQAGEPSAAKIAIYHTHNDESYIPTDGKATEPGNGSVMQVGATFASRLQELGYIPVHNTTLHEPHDANAYQRSRRTFTKLLTDQPAALFDIHRDSTPLQTYKTKINGEDTAKVMLVVGRQNQNRSTTQNYARQLKRAADQKYKGLVRGIFIAHGNYNQDLNPRAMLVEVGTQYNTREAAERGIALFADVIPSVIAPNRNGSAAAQTETQIPAGQNLADNTPVPGDRSIVGDILFILGAVIAGAIFYLYLSTGSLREAKEKVKKFTKYEFTNFLGPRKDRK